MSAYELFIGKAVAGLFDGPTERTRTYYIEGLDLWLTGETTDDSVEVCSEECRDAWLFEWAATSVVTVFKTNFEGDDVWVRHDGGTAYTEIFVYDLDDPAPERRPVSCWECDEVIFEEVDD